MFKCMFSSCAILFYICQAISRIAVSAWALHRYNEKVIYIYTYSTKDQKRLSALLGGSSVRLPPLAHRVLSEIFADLCYIVRNLRKNMYDINICEFGDEFSLGHRQIFQIR